MKTIASYSVISVIYSLGLCHILALCSKELQRGTQKLEHVFFERRQMRFFSRYLQTLPYFERPTAPSPKPRHQPHS